jgi:hypothetical protein
MVGFAPKGCQKCVLPDPAGAGSCGAKGPEPSSCLVFEAQKKKLRHVICSSQLPSGKLTCWPWSNSHCWVETNLPTPMTARVYVSLLHWKDINLPTTINQPLDIFLDPTWILEWFHRTWIISQQSGRCESLSHHIRLKKWGENLPR